MLLSAVRTTISLDDDVAAAVQEQRRERSLGLSVVVNSLLREALAKQKQPRRQYVHTSRRLGLKLDVSDVADALEVLDQHDGE
jgi:hypothetical protein